MIVPDQLTPEQREAYLDSPSLLPPAGIKPDFTNPPNNNVVAEALIPILLTLVTAVLLLRTYAKFFITKTINIDDLLIFVGYGTYIVYLYDVYHVTHNVGLFVHQWNATVREVMDTSHILQFGATFYIITLAIVKVSILLQWMRIFSPKGTQGLFYWCCQFLLWTNLLVYLSANVAGNLICVPFERIWDKTVPGVCYNGRPLNLAIGIFNLISDILLLLLPQKIIWGLNMSWKRRVGIAITFGTGLVAIAAAAFRLGVTVTYLHDTDWLFRVSGLSIGCITEMSAIILVYCLPGLPRAFSEKSIPKKLGVSLVSWIKSTSDTRHSNTNAESDRSFDNYGQPQLLNSRESHGAYQGHIKPPGSAGKSQTSQNDSV